MTPRVGFLGAGWIGRHRMEAMLAFPTFGACRVPVSVSVFDVFAGPRAEAQMGPGKKSLAIAVRLQPVTATLTEAEIEAVSRRVVAGVEKATGGMLRA